MVWITLASEMELAVNDTVSTNETVWRVMQVQKNLLNGDVQEVCLQEERRETLGWIQHVKMWSPNPP